ncbi:VanW family protein [Brevibacillus laterosporus]|uniref:VanW family protein n=1 Tax=Brevibacillus laterosporus TaxID=1465 RepID=UPI0009F3B8F5|nr:VanW family protein [Brevibacillus laterosporus]
MISLMAGLMLVLQLQGNVPVVQKMNQDVVSIDRKAFTLPFTHIPILDVSKLEAYMSRLERQVYRSPMNAKWDEREKIIPEKNGQRLNRQAFMESFISYFYTNQQTHLQIPTLTVLPKVDASLLKDVSQKQIGAYVTYYNPRNKNRASNIALSSKSIDNVVLFPGETFSFNQTVGERTTKRGYLPAPVIVRGELSEGIGGGICQVSSTLYNAVDKSGLKIIQRYAHSRNVAYVPPGRDATVSWYGPDFRFQNRYAYPILIRARAFNGMVAVRIFSFSDLDYDPREVPTVRKRLPEETDQPLDNESSKSQPKLPLH